MIAGLSAGFVFPAIVQLVRPSASLAGPAFSLLAVLAITVAVVITFACGTADRRVAVLAATGLLVNLIGALTPAAGLTAAVVLLLVRLLAAVLVWLVAIAFWRRRARRASRAAAG